MIWCFSSQGSANLTEIARHFRLVLPTEGRRVGAYYDFQAFSIRPFRGILLFLFATLFRILLSAIPRNNLLYEARLTTWTDGKEEDAHRRHKVTPGARFRNCFYISIDSYHRTNHKFRCQCRKGIFTERRHPTQKQKSSKGGAYQILRTSCTDSAEESLVSSQKGY